MARFIGRRVGVVSVGCLLAALFPAAMSAELPESCEGGAQWPLHAVSRVLDGDTVKLVDGRTIRVLGLNSPELYRGATPEPLGEDARRVFAGLVGRAVRLRLGEVKFDKHRRWLAHVYDANGENVAAKLLQLGLGFQVVQAPETYGADCYRDAETVAKMRELGVWGEPYFAPVQVNENLALKSGFVRVLGRIENISFARKAVWIDLEGDVTLYIPPKAKAFFVNVLSSSLIGDRVAVQGWIVDRKKDKARKKHIRKRWMLILTHPNMVEFLKNSRGQP